MQEEIVKLNIKSQNLAAKASEELSEKGVVIIEDFIDSATCEELIALLQGDQLENSNDLTFVHMRDARFFSNAVAESKAAFDTVTSNSIREVAASYLKQPFRLKCHRVYSTKSGYNFPWHTDNKYDNDKNEENGIVAIIYLVDTLNGATEFVLGSHKFSEDSKYNNYTDDFIQSNYSDKVRSTPARAGSVVISDIRTIHRGSVSKNGPIDRYSFWFQLDCSLEKAERLLLNPEFLPNKIPDDLSSYLGFGKPFGLQVHPATTNQGKILPIPVRLNRMFKYIWLTIIIPTLALHKLPEWLKVGLKKRLKPADFEG